MRCEFTAIVERGSQFVIAFCPEVPGANGQGNTREEALDDLRAAIALVLDVQRDEYLRNVSDDTERTTVVVEH